MMKILSNYLLKEKIYRNLFLGSIIYIIIYEFSWFSVASKHYILINFGNIFINVSYAVLTGLIFYFFIEYYPKEKEKREFYKINIYDLVEIFLLFVDILTYLYKNDDESESKRKIYEELNIKLISLLYENSNNKLLLTLKELKQNTNCDSFGYTELDLDSVEIKYSYRWNNHKLDKISFDARNTSLSDHNKKWKILQSLIEQLERKVDRLISITNDTELGSLLSEIKFMKFLDELKFDLDNKEIDICYYLELLDLDLDQSNIFYKEFDYIRTYYSHLDNIIIFYGLDVEIEYRHK